MTEQLIMEENGRRYRMLQVGETLEVGDQVNLIHNGGWKNIRPNTAGNVVRIPGEGCLPQGFYRRPIADHPANDPHNVAAAILEARQ